MIESLFHETKMSRKEKGTVSIACFVQRRGELISDAEAAEDTNLLDLAKQCILLEALRSLS